MSHTPGPWEISLREMLDGWVIVADRDGGIVANVNTETGPNIPPLVSRKMPAGANAALIAAAPELLAALKRMWLYFGVRCDGTPRDWTEWREARDAIAKAEGSAVE